MADFIAIEEINNHIDNAVNANNANTSAYYANQRAYYANQHAYNSNTNASKCNQILSNIYYTNGDTKKSWHLYIINQNLGSLNTTPFQLTNIYLYGLSVGTWGSSSGRWNLYINDTNIIGAGSNNVVLGMRGGNLQFGANRANVQTMTNWISQGWTVSFKIPVANLYINASCAFSLTNVYIMYSVYE